MHKPTPTLSSLRPAEQLAAELEAGRFDGELTRHLLVGVDAALAVVALALLASACGPSLAAEGSQESGTTETSTTETSTTETSTTETSTTETGDDSCPALLWSDDEPGFGALEITSMEQANALPPYTQIDGTLRIHAVAGIVDLHFLSCLEVIRGGLSIVDNPDLQTFDGLQRLSGINSPHIEYASVFIARNQELRDFDGLSGLEVLPRLSIEDNPLLETIDGLANLRTAEVISIQRNEILPTIDLPNLESVEILEIGAVECPLWEPNVEPEPDPYPAGNPGLVNLDGLMSLQSYEDLRLRGNVNLSSIDGIFGASGNDPYVNNFVELNPMLAYEAIAQLPGWIDSCGNLNENSPCDCGPTRGD